MDLTRTSCKLEQGDDKQDEWDTPDITVLRVFSGRGRIGDGNKHRWALSSALYEHAAATRQPGISTTIISWATADNEERSIGGEELPISDFGSSDHTIELHPHYDSFKLWEPSLEAYGIDFKLY